MRQNLEKAHVARIRKAVLFEDLEHESASGELFLRRVPPSRTRPY